MRDRGTEDAGANLLTPNGKKKIHIEGRVGLAYRVSVGGETVQLIVVLNGDAA